MSDKKSIKISKRSKKDETVVVNETVKEEEHPVVDNMDHVETEKVEEPVVVENKSKNNTVFKIDSIVDKLLVYVPESNHIAALSSINDLLSNSSKHKNKKKRKTKSKLEDEPKRPVSAYVLYTKDRRESVMEELRPKYADNKVPFIEITRVLADYWRKETESVKAEYEAKHVEAKKKYEEALNVFYMKHTELIPKKKQVKAQ